MPRLTIELVPSSCWFSNVRSAVPESVWDKLKKTAYKLAHYRCEVCSGRGRQWPVEAHEVWHYDDKLHLQKLVRLIALCPMCHKVKHIGLAEVNGWLEESIQHLMKVNHWPDKVTATSYVKESFRIWQERSKFDWTLDISALAQYGITLKDIAVTKPLEDRVERNQQYEATQTMLGGNTPESDFDPYDHIIGEERVA